MPEQWKNPLSESPRKRKRNHLAEVLVVLLGLLLVAFFFGSGSRFDLSPKEQRAAKSSRKLVYTGELDPAGLKLSKTMLRPLERLVQAEGRHLRQVRIHIERQDPYAALTDSTELRFWCTMEMADGRVVRTVVDRATRRNIADALARRIRGDLESYRRTLREHGSDGVGSFTHTM